VLIKFTPVVGKTIAPGVTAIAAPTAPVPLSRTVAGVVTEAELNVNTPVVAPVTAGAKITPTEQLAPAAKLPPQVLCVRLNGGGTVCPVTPSVSPVAAYVLVFVRFTVCAALDCPMLTTPKLNCAGLTFRPDWICPVPFSGTVTWVTPADEEETTSEAALPPVVSGVKITGTVQLLPAFSVAPLVVGQVVAPVVKKLACEPEIAKPRFAIGAPPVFVTVSVNGELARPTCCPANVRLDGVTLIAPGCTPVPFRATV
jgi:hypothetical protein